MGEMCKYNQKKMPQIYQILFKASLTIYFQVIKFIFVFINFVPQNSNKIFFKT